MTRTSPTAVGAPVGGAAAPNTANATVAPTPATQQHNSWASLTPLPNVVGYEGAAVGPDGRIYAVGGCPVQNCPQPLAGVEVYTAESKSWKQVAPLPSPRGGLSAVTGPDGRIYAIGGWSTCGGGSCTPVNTVEAYDVKANTWTTVASMSQVRYGLGLVLGPDHRIYAIGGCGGGACTQDLATVEAFDVGSNQWATVAPLSTPTDSLVAVMEDQGHILALGGCSGGTCGTTKANVAEYDIKANKWADIASMNIDRDSFSAVTGADGAVYVIGGFSNGRGNALLTDVQRYSPQEKKWTGVAPLPMPWAGMAAVVGTDGRIYVISGCTQAKCPTEQVTVYLP